MAEITDRETHKREWNGSFHMVGLAALEYNSWQVRFHGMEARLNFPWGTAPAHLVPSPPGLVDVAMAREDREVRERIMGGGPRQGVRGGPPPPVP